MKVKRYWLYVQDEAHCIEIRSEVCKKLPFLPESYWNEADLSFLQDALEKHQNEDISLKDLMRLDQKSWGRWITGLPGEETLNF